MSERPNDLFTNNQQLTVPALRSLPTSSHRTHISYRTLIDKLAVEVNKPLTQLTGNWKASEASNIFILWSNGKRYLWVSVFVTAVVTKVFHRFFSAKSWLSLFMSNQCWNNFKMAAVFNTLRTLCHKRYNIFWKPIALNWNLVKDCTSSTFLVFVYTYGNKIAFN